MIQISVNDFQKLHQALIAKFTRDAFIQIFNGFIVFTCGGALLGLLFGSIFYAALAGFATHALLIIVGNDSIEKFIKVRSEETAREFKQRVLAAPKIIQDKYLQCIRNYDAEQTKRWARKNFAIVIKPEEMIELFND